MATSKKTSSTKKTTKKAATTRKKKDESVGDEIMKDLKRIGKREFTKKTGIPTSKSGIKNKIGRWIVDSVLDMFTKSDKKKKDED